MGTTFVLRKIPRGAVRALARQPRSCDHAKLARRASVAIKAGNARRAIALLKTASKTAKKAGEPLLAQDYAARALALEKKLEE